MADSSFGLRDITLDLTVAGARVIRDATKGEMVKITGLTLSGVGAATGVIILRFESASGPMVWRFDPAGATLFNVDVSFGEALGGRIGKGLYADALGAAWAAGAVLIIHTA